MIQQSKAERQKASLDEAYRRVSDTEFLVGREEFTRFMDLIRMWADALANEILHDDMTGEERERRRQYRMGLLSVLSAPAEIIMTNRKVIEESERLSRS